MNLVTDKIAIVTGGAQGIGAATARMLAAGGAHVVIADIATALGEQTAAEIRAAGGRAEFAQLDVASETQWKALVERLCATHGGLDILVNNAGIEFNKYLQDVTLEDWRKLNAINGEGVFLGTKYCIWGMTQGSTTRPQGGSVVTVASVAGLQGFPGLSAYCMSKGGVRIFSKAVAVECGLMKNGVRSNVVCPGIIKTPMYDSILPEWTASGVGATIEETVANLEKLAPMGRIGKAEEVAAAICFLASDDASFITGTDIIVDGGTAAW